MRTLRRLLTGVALATMAVGVASADNIISYTVTIPMQTTDITDALALVTAWCPGCNSSAQDTIASTAEPAGYGVTDTAVGVTMASLDAANTTYTLQGYDIRVSSIITGNYTISNAADASSNTTGNAHLDSYTAVSLGSQLAPPLNNSIQEPTNDLFYAGNPNSYGYGPDPATSSTGVNLTPGNASTVSFSNVTQNADVGCDFFPNTSAAPCSSYTEISPVNSIPGINVETTNGPNDFLSFYFSTSTQVDSSLSGGNFSTTNQTSVKEKVTVTYDYTTSLAPSVPEPMTMILMGSALVGLGLVGKRLKKS